MRLSSTRQSVLIRLTLTCAIPGILIMHADPADAQLTLKLRAEKHACRNVPVLIPLSPEALKRLGRNVPGAVRLESGEDTTIGQIWQEGDTTALVFLPRELPRGATRTYRVRPERRTQTAVTVQRQDSDMVVMLGSRLFTRYHTQTSPFKPFLYPLLTPGGEHFTRRFPQEKVAGESTDHVHHRGLWFTHGEVNGVDFWSEGQQAGRTVHTGYAATFQGPVMGGFVALTEWRAPDNTLVATDRRTVRVIPLPNGDRILDFEITMRPAGKELHFGDTKEGTFGIRVAESLAPKPDRTAGIQSPTGRMINSEGAKDGAVWGKKAAWVDYSGPIGGEIYGIAIFDHPTNFRFPTTWHAREYGLFAANPFGLHDFNQGAKGAGDYRVASDATFTLRYRVLLHRGTPETADVATRFAVYAEPPVVEIQ
ncbi:MAG: PmoA family protein [Chloroherpetonaceae bacterium]|nr:PmoA family protein [Chthonomonadaceae bacterium]MDW8207132.1 PmoA family protein [Chloroherpetonaceae bacterium]